MRLETLEIEDGDVVDRRVDQLADRLCCKRKAPEAHGGVDLSVAMPFDGHPHVTRDRHHLGAGTVAVDVHNHDGVRPVAAFVRCVIDILISSVSSQEHDVDGVALLRDRLLAGEDLILLELLSRIVEGLPEVEDVSSDRDAVQSHQNGQESEDLAPRPRFPTTVAPTITGRSNTPPANHLPSHQYSPASPSPQSLGSTQQLPKSTSNTEGVYGLAPPAGYGVTSPNQIPELWS